MDNKLLGALNTISQTQTKPTTTTKQMCNHLLNYCGKYTNVGLTKMILHVNSDASFLIAPEAKSRITVYFRLQNQSTSNEKPNAPILVECLTFKHIVTLAAECETAGIFH